MIAGERGTKSEYAARPLRKGPKRRNPLHSVRRHSLDVGDTIASPAESDYSSYEERHFAYSREGSVNRTTLSHEQEQFDSDDSLSDACTDDMEQDMEEKRRHSPFVAEKLRIDNQRTKSTFKHSYDAGTDNMSRFSGEERSHTPFETESLKRSKKTAFSSYKAVSDKMDTLTEGLVVERLNPMGTSNIRLTIICIVKSLLLISVVIYFGYFNRTDKPIECETFFKLQNRYINVQQSLWGTLDASIRRATTTEHKREPATILLLHYGTTRMLDDFISNVITITTSCFGGTKPIQLVGGHFKRSDIQKDYGVFLAQQKEDLQQQRIMVVRNLEDIPAQAAQAFHTICDTQEPLVDNAVIYLTLDMSRVRNVYELTEESAMSEAERSLRALWKNSLPPEVLESLITRLTENVYRIV